MSLPPYLEGNICAFIPVDGYINAIEYRGKAHFKPPHDIKTRYGEFNRDGSFRIYAGYIYKANFPAINTLDSRLGALIHDFFYELVKDGLLSREYRYDIDYLFYNVLVANGMIELRALGWFKAVRIGGDAALDSPRPQVRYAPGEPSLPPGWQLTNILQRSPF